MKKMIGIVNTIFVPKQSNIGGVEFIEYKSKTDLAKSIIRETLIDWSEPNGYKESKVWDYEQFLKQVLVDIQKEKHEDDHLEIFTTKDISSFNPVCKKCPNVVIDKDKYGCYFPECFYYKC